MSESHLAASVRARDGVCIIDLRGELNAQGEDALNRAYAEAIQQNPSHVLLNFREVDYINSTGIALIVGVLGQARKAGRTLVSYGLSEHYQEIFTITRLSEFMQLVSDEAAALAIVQTAASSNAR